MPRSPIIGWPSMLSPSARAGPCASARILRVEQVAEIDGLARRVRQFDADRIAAGDDGDARGGGGHGARDVFGERDDFEDRTPAAGSSSNRVTTGPGRTSVMRPLMPNSVSTPPRRSAISSRRASSTSDERGGGTSSSSSGGMALEASRPRAGTGVVWLALRGSGGLRSCAA